MHHLGTTVETTENMPDYADFVILGSEKHQSDPVFQVHYIAFITY